MKENHFNQNYLENIHNNANICLKLEPLDLDNGKNKRKIKNEQEQSRSELNTQRNQEFKREKSVEFLLILPVDSHEERVHPVSVKEEQTTAKPPKIKPQSFKSKEDIKRNPNQTNIKSYFQSKQKKASGKVGTIRCRECMSHKIFNTHKELKRHQNQEHISCKKCMRIYIRASSFETHRCFINKKSRDDYRCKYCNAEFANRWNLAQHIAIHMDTMKEACKICGKMYVKDRLRQHMNHVHDQRKPFSCDLCGFKTKAKNQLENHMKSHLKPYKCKKCGKTFSESRYFLEHQLNHDNPNPFKCKLCSSAFTRKTSLIRHMHTAHSDERQFPCSYPKCKYSGKTQNDLTTHTMSHTKAFKCDKCPRKFSRSTLLNQHRVLHDNPNAYLCEKCKQAFTQRKLLKEHITKKNHICKRRQIELGLIDSDSEEEA